MRYYCSSSSTALVALVSVGVLAVFAATESAAAAADSASLKACSDALDAFSADNAIKPCLINSDPDVQSALKAAGTTGDRAAAISVLTQKCGSRSGCDAQPIWAKFQPAYTTCKAASSSSDDTASAAGAALPVSFPRSLSQLQRPTELPAMLLAIQGYYCATDPATKDFCVLQIQNASVNLARQQSVPDLSSLTSTYCGQRFLATMNSVRPLLELVVPSNLPIVAQLFNQSHTPEVDAMSQDISAQIKTSGDDVAAAKSPSSTTSSPSSSPTSSTTTLCISGFAVLVVVAANVVNF